MPAKRSYPFVRICLFTSIAALTASLLHADLIVSELTFDRGYVEITNASNSIEVVTKLSISSNGSQETLENHRIEIAPRETRVYKVQLVLPSAGSLWLSAVLPDSSSQVESLVDGVIWGDSADSDPVVTAILAENPALWGTATDYVSTLGISLGSKTLQRSNESHGAQAWTVKSPTWGRYGVVPDLKVGKSLQNMAGEGILSDTGLGQNLEIGAVTGGTKEFLAKLSNLGEADDQIELQGSPGGSGFEIQWLDVAGINVTSDVLTGSIWNIGPGEEVLLKGIVRSDAGGSATKATYEFQLRSQSQTNPLIGDRIIVSVGQSSNSQAGGNGNAGGNGGGVANHFPEGLTLPSQVDADGNGIPDVIQAEIETGPPGADSDGDGISDQIELLLGTDPFVDEIGSELQGAGEGVTGLEVFTPLAM